MEDRVTSPQENLPGLSDGSGHSSFGNEDKKLTIQDIINSAEYQNFEENKKYIWQRKRWIYRSALERSICPKRPLPKRDTLRTIYEDLPWPKVTYMTPPSSREKLKDEALQEEAPPLPKKRFRGVRKFFSRMNCFGKASKKKK